MQALKIFLITILFTPPVAIAQEPPSTNCLDYFNWSQQSEEQQAWTQESLSLTDFPCEKLAPDVKSSEYQAIWVFEKELDGCTAGKPCGTLGQAGDYWILMEEGIHSGRLYRKVFLHEMGHAVDHHYMTEKHREIIIGLFNYEKGKCWGCDRAHDRRVVEAYAHGFVKAFSDVNPELIRCPREGQCRQFPHPVTVKRVKGIRRTLLKY